jgi:tetratricopeptide (TPR) repeat protein
MLLMAHCPSSRVAAAVGSRVVAEVSRSVTSMADGFGGMLELQEAVEARLAKAEHEYPLAYALVMAALSWDQVDHRGWHPPKALCSQARRLMAVWRTPAGSVDDLDAVSSALDWAMRAPALLERDDQGRYRPLLALVSPGGPKPWRNRHRQAAASGALTPLEFVERGDAECHRSQADLDVAEASYRFAVDSDDPDAAALASLRLAELSERLDQPVEAARRYAEVADMRHPIASPHAVLWLAHRAAQDGDHAAARTLARQVADGDVSALLSSAWDLLGSIAWLQNDRDTAIAEMRRAVDVAGEWHGPHTQRLAAMLAGCGDVSGAADAYRTMLDLPIVHGPDAAQYVQLMAAVGRIDEAVAVLEQYVVADGLFAGHFLLALASAHMTREDTATARQTLARLRAHWSAAMPTVSVPADVIEASLAAAEGDDRHAANLFRSLTDTDDIVRRDLARPLLIAAGMRFAADEKICMIPGVRPLLEYLSEAAPPLVAAWAAISLAHLATVEGRSHDAEAGVRLAARYLSAEEVTILRARLLRRAGQDRDAIEYLISSCVTATPSALIALLPALIEFEMRGIHPDRGQRARLRIAVDNAMAGDDSPRELLAFVMASIEQHVCLDRVRAIELWEIATDSYDPEIAANALLNLGLMQQMSAPIVASQALERAMLTGDGPISGQAAAELARLADQLGDNTILVRASERLLEITDGDERANAALRLGQIIQYAHPDDAEDAYHAAIAEPGAHPDTIGAAMARLGALYALHGNRRLARRIWRRGQRHTDPRIADAFAAERAAIGRVTRLRNRPYGSL